MKIRLKFAAYLFWMANSLFTNVQAGALSQTVNDSEYPTKSVAGASQIAVCSGAHGGEALNCNFGDVGDSAKRSVYSLAASGWRLVAVSFDPNKKISYYYFLLN